MDKLLNLTNIDITVTKAHPFQYRNRKCNFQFKQAPRENYGLLFMEFGSIIFDIGGKMIQTQKGDILLLKKGESYVAQSTASPEAPYAFYIIAFDIAEDSLPAFRRITHTSHYEKFLDLFVRGKSITGADIAYNLELKSIVNEILCNLYKEYYTAIAVPPSYSCIERAKNYIDTNYKENILIDDLAGISGFSRAHFKRLFQEYYHISPSEYITTVRINHAKSMLKSNIFFLSEIAAECGFSNEYYFSQVFKKIVGCSPKNY